MGALNAPEPGSYQKLSEEQRLAIQSWLTWLQLHHTGQSKGVAPVGLWVNGPRRSGTTYVASVAVKRAVRKIDRHCYGTYDWEYITARELNGVVRLLWDSTTVQHQHPQDYDLFREATQTEIYIDALERGLDLVWLDDVQIGTTDMTFFGKHLWPILEERVKNGKATVVSTSLSGKQLGKLEPVVNDLFVPCKVEPRAGR